MENTHFITPFFFFFPFLFMAMALVPIAFFFWFAKTRHASMNAAHKKDSDMAGPWPMTPWAMASGGMGPRAFMQRFFGPASEDGTSWNRPPSTGPVQPTGNAAFDAYRQEVLNKLDEDAKAFADYRDRLRQARDSQEFDRFMDDTNPTSSGPQTDKD